METAGEPATTAVDGAAEGDIAMGAAAVEVESPAVEEGAAEEVDVAAAPATAADSEEVVDPLSLITDTAAAKASDAPASKVLEPPLPSDGLITVVFQAGSLGLSLDKRSAERGVVLNRFTKEDGQAKACGLLEIGDTVVSVAGESVLGRDTAYVVGLVRRSERPLAIGFRRPDPEDAPPLPGRSGAANAALRAPLTDDPVRDLVFLDGESKYAGPVDAVAYVYNSPKTFEKVSGTVWVTDYRLVFRPRTRSRSVSASSPRLPASGGASGGASSDGGDDDDAEKEKLPLDDVIPLLCLERVDVEGAPGAGVTGTKCLHLRCKHTLQRKYVFAASAMLTQVYRLLKSLAFAGNSLFAFAYCYKKSVANGDAARGWGHYDAAADYARLGMTQHPGFRVVDNGHALCPTYPRTLLVPSAMTPAEVETVAAFRSKKRLPVAVWMHPRTKAVLSRCSQPMVGVRAARDRTDEKHLVQLAKAGGNTNPRRVIADARSKIAAMGNQALGKGTEAVANYHGYEMIHFNIANIHSVRSSWNGVRELCVASAVDDGDGEWLKKLHDTGWLKQVRSVLAAAQRMALLLHREAVSVVNHCSDGWDRTAQMCATAELLLDPHYRSLPGFVTLVTKHWCSFGHKFGDRCAHGISLSAEDHQNRPEGSPDLSHKDERSPIFGLWIDCVWQIMRQRPTVFEFNETFLVALLDHVWAARFGDFLFNSEKERIDNNVFTDTHSFATHAETHRAEFTNPLWRPATDRISHIRFSSNPRNLILWRSYFFRFERSLMPWETLPTFC